MQAQERADISVEPDAALVKEYKEKLNNQSGVDIRNKNIRDKQAARSAAIFLACRIALPIPLASLIHA